LLTVINGEPHPIAFPEPEGFLLDPHAGEVL
jgi:hypothetical protein